MARSCSMLVLYALMGISLALHVVTIGGALMVRSATKVDADLLITGHIPCEKGFEVPNDRQVILDCMGSPACYCLLPADRPLAHDELVGCVRTL